MSAIALSFRFRCLSRYLDSRQRRGLLGRWVKLAPVTTSLTTQS